MRALPFIALLLISPACDVDEPCGPDQVLDDELYACVDADGEPDGAVDAGSADGGSSSGGDGAVCDDVPHGTTCTDGTNHSDCGCPADFCAKQPGAASGFCTHVGCLEGTPCPDGFRCFDISSIDPELGSLCIPS